MNVNRDGPDKDVSLAGSSGRVRCRQLSNIAPILDVL